MFLTSGITPSKTFLLQQPLERFTSRGNCLRNAVSLKVIPGCAVSVLEISKFGNLCEQSLLRSLA